MGNDGGSIAKRIDLVREKTKEIRKDTITNNQNRSRYCAISNTTLQKPIVGCRLGYIYNKEALLSCLINKTMPKTFNHIIKMKDVRDIRATENSNLNSPYPLVCPLTAIEYNGVAKFVFIWTCGCLLTEKALTKPKSADEKLNCPLCNTEFQEKDIIPLYLSPEEIEVKKQLLLSTRKGQVDSKKEAKLGVN